MQIQMVKKNSFLKSEKGFTLMEILIVAAIVGVLATIGAIMLLDRQSAANSDVCKASLRNIMDAKVLYAKDNHLTGTDAFPVGLNDLRDAFTGKTIPVCPDGGTYSMGATVNDPPTCSHGGHSL